MTETAGLVGTGMEAKVNLLGMIKLILVESASRGQQGHRAEVVWAQKIHAMCKHQMQQRAGEEWCLSPLGESTGLVIAMGTGVAWSSGA